METFRRAGRLAPMLANKGAKRVMEKVGIAKPPTPTRREFDDVSNWQQKVQWISGATEIWYERERPSTQPPDDHPDNHPDNHPESQSKRQSKSPVKRPVDHLCVLSIGSSFDLAASDVWTKYAGVINCCPNQYSRTDAPHDDLYTEITVDDVNDAELDADQLEAAFTMLRGSLDDDRDLLVNCQMGASRSVAVSIYLLGRLHGDFDWEKWRDIVRTQRTHINVSLALKASVERAWTACSGKKSS